MSFPHLLQAIDEEASVFASGFLIIAILKRHSSVYLNSDVMLTKNLGPMLLGGAIVSVVEYYHPILESQNAEASLLNGI